MPSKNAIIACRFNIGNFPEVILRPGNIIGQMQKRTIYGKNVAHFITNCTRFQAPEKQ